MLLDLRAAVERELATDLCIVGGGPAGIAMALSLAGGPLDVLLLESGGLEPSEETRELDRGEVRGERYFDLREPRVRALGGSSAIWSGELALLRAEDFAPRPWLGVTGWPIPHSELAAHYPRALELCGGSAWAIGPDPYDDPLAGAPPEPGGAPWLEVRQRRRSEPRPRSFGQHFRHALESAGNVRTVLHATAVRLDLGEGGSRLRAIEVATPEGTRAQVHARGAVLACGGLENPRLLLLSGLGDRLPAAGRFFQEHPVVRLGEVTGGSAGLAALWHERAGTPRLLRDLCPTRPFAEREQVLEFQIELLPDGGGKANGDAAGAVELLGWPGGPGGAVHCAIADVMLEMLPDAGNRVGLGEELDPLGSRRLRLELRLESTLRRTLTAAARGLVRELGRREIGLVELSSAAIAAGRGESPAWRGARHHLGTTRMADDPVHGVVDRHCRVHGIDNLWIAGGSVFPVSGYVNPTVTIVALALRLASHLENRLR
jgi:choline dehydrogenase-like flavoprotein